MVLKYTLVSCLSGVQGLVNTSLRPGHCFSKGLSQWERAVMLLCHLHHSGDVTGSYCKCFWKHRRINSGALAGCSISPFLCTATVSLHSEFSLCCCKIRINKFQGKKKAPKCCINCVIKILFYHTRGAELMYNLNVQSDAAIQQNWCCSWEKPQPSELLWLVWFTLFHLSLWQIRSDSREGGQKWLSGQAN